MQGFKGFSNKTLQFLQEVTRHNSKEWFEEHRSLYDENLLHPFKQLVETLTPCMLAIDERFETRPAIGKTLSRINRDTRFSRDKSRYRGRFWLSFKRPSKDWKESPTYFFEIATDWYRYGLGYYSAPKYKMDLLRRFIEQDIKAFEKLIYCYQSPFELIGDSYKKSLNKALPEHIATWYNRKNLAIMVSSQQVERLFNKQLVNELTSAFQQLVPLYHYLQKIETYNQ